MRIAASVALMIALGLAGPAEASYRRARRGDPSTPRSELLRSDGYGFFAAGGAVLTALTGAGLMLGGSVKEWRSRERNEDAAMAALLGEAETAPLAAIEAAYPTARLHRDMRLAVDLKMAGGAVIASSLGGLVMVLTQNSMPKRWFAGVLLAQGAVMTAGGGVWMGSAIGRRDALLAPQDPGHRATWGALHDGAWQRAGSAILVGLGTAMVVYSAGVLINDAANRRYWRRRGDLSLTPTLTGDRALVVLQGRF